MVILSTQSAFVMHPVNVTVTDISWKEGKATLQFMFFTDDFESCLQENFHTDLDFVNKGIDSNGEKLIQQYIESNFAIDVNGNHEKLNFIQVWAKGEVLYVKYEAPAQKTSDVKSVKIKNTLLFSDFPEQKNIVNIHYNEDLKILSFKNGGETEKAITF
jgi:hypothetical protein